MATKAKEPKQASAAVGDSGTAVLGGYISGEEYNKDLVGKSGYDKYDEMRRSDATVKAALSAVMLPIMAAQWTVKEATADEEDKATQDLNKQVKEFVEHCLLKQQNWDQLLSEILTMLPFGYSVFEIVWTPIDYEGVQYVGLDKLASRKQKTILKWETEDGKPGVQQQRSTGKPVSIPDEKLCVFTNQREGDNYEGISVLRAAYKPWYMKTNLEKIDAMVHERQGLGMMVLRIPFGADKDSIAKAREIARNARANEEAYVELPKGFEMEFMEMHTSSQREVLPSITYHQREIMKSVLAQFLELGSKDGSGSYALSEDHSQLFLLSLESISKNIASVINEKVVKRLVDLNGWGVKEYPELICEKIGQQDIKKVSDAVRALMSVYGLTPSAGTEKFLRDLFGLPPLEKEIADDYSNRQLPQQDKNPQNQIDQGLPEDKQADAVIEQAIGLRRAMDRKAFGNAGAR